MKKLILSFIFLLLFLTFIQFSLTQSEEQTPPPPPPIPPPPLIEDGGSVIESLNASSCNDKIKNQDETDIDCGGNCGKCTNGNLCLVDSDCISDYCNPDNKCSIPSCRDGWKNGNETGLDCGGDCKSCNATKQTNDAQNLEQYKIEEQAEIQDSIKYAENEEIQKKPSDVIEKPKNEKNILLTFSLVLIFILIILLLTFLFLHYRKKQTNSDNRYQKQDLDMSRKVDPDQMKLNNYIKNCLNQGYSPEAIKQILLKKNWPEQKINQAFNKLRRW